MIKEDFLKHMLLLLRSLLYDSFWNIITGTLRYGFAAAATFLKQIKELFFHEIYINFKRNSERVDVKQRV